MSQSVIRVEGLSKRYQLGTIGYGSLQHDLVAWWARVRGKSDPNTKIGEKSRLDLHGDFWALRNVDFEVAPGSRVGIIGRNGAGKSTLLKLLSRVTSPTAGSIRVKGRIASLLEVGTGFHPELTGRENIFLNGAILGMKRLEIQKKFDEIVDFAGVDAFVDTPVKRYSSGMYVRLAFSVAAHLDSQILIIDEVLAVGDVEFQKKCLGKMEDISKGQGRTILFVSHQIGAVRTLCDSAILLNEGAIEYRGGVDQTLAAYLKTDVADQSDLSQLGDRPRPRGMSACFRSIRFEGLYGENGLLVEMGSGFSFVTRISTGLPSHFLNLIVGINLPSGERIATFASVENFGSQFIRCSSGEFRVRFSSLVLAPGTYYITFSLQADDRLIDNLENLVRLVVAEKDYFQTGRVFREGYGLTFLKGDLETLTQSQS